MNAVVSALAGKKTYLVAIAMVIAAGLHACDYIDDTTFKVVEGLLTGSGLAALRAGVTRSIANAVQSAASSTSAKTGVVLIVLVGALALSGCGLVARDIGYAGAHPGSFTVDCSPDGASLTVQGNIAAMLYGSNNAASILCKGKVSITQGPPSVAPGAPATK